MTLRQIANEKAKFIEEIEESFLKGIQATEKALFSEVKKLIDSLDRVNDRISDTKRNKNLINKIKKKLIEIIQQSTLKRKLDGFTKAFDKIDDFNRDIYKDTGFDIDIAEDKKDFTDAIGDILKASVLTTEFIRPLSRMIRKAISSGGLISDLINNARDFIKGTGRGGRLRKYIGQRTVDALNQYDGDTQDKVRDRYSMDVFFYLGSLIKDSRQNCRDLVAGTGKFKDLALSAGKYPVQAIPEILELAKTGKGFNPIVTPETFAQYRMGYNCRHQVIYTKATAREREIINQRYGLAAT